MNQAKQIEDEYSRQMRELLSDYPADLRIFEGLWAAGKLREAYVFVTEATKRLGLVRSAKNRKADEDFFWTYMH